MVSIPFVVHIVCVCMNYFDVDHFKAQGSWDLIWKLKIPPKVKNLIQRVCRNTLPTRVRLGDRGVNCAKVCALCNMMEEDNLHLFFRCPGSCNIWSMCESSTTINNVISQGHDIADTIFQLPHMLNGDDAALLCCIIWSIWKQQNNKIWNDVADAHMFVLERARTMLQDWRAEKSYRQRPSRMPNIIDNSKWKKPAEGRYKCNIDASFSRHLNKVGIGICLRDGT